MSVVPDSGERPAAPGSRWPTPPGGWPAWAWDAPYSASLHPMAQPARPLDVGANCQRYAYAVLALFGLEVPMVFSSELWTAKSMQHVDVDAIKPLDLILFNASEDPYGAHVGVLMHDDEVLHLCAEIGRPEVWAFSAFARRSRYAVTLGALRAGNV